MAIEGSGSGFFSPNISLAEEIFPFIHDPFYELD
jgi:hypothetical protein